MMLLKNLSMWRNSLKSFRHFTNYDVFICDNSVALYSFFPKYAGNNCTVVHWKNLSIEGSNSEFLTRHFRDNFLYSHAEFDIIANLVWSFVFPDSFLVQHKSRMNFYLYYTTVIFYETLWSRLSYLLSLIGTKMIINLIYGSLAIPLGQQSFMSEISELFSTGTPR